MRFAEAPSQVPVSRITGQVLLTEIHLSCKRVHQEPSVLDYSQCMQPAASSEATRAPRGLIAIGTFLLLGAGAAFLAGMTLVWRGTVLDRMWTVNPRAYNQLAPYGKIIGIPFLLLGIVLASSGVGWLKRREWGWRLVTVIIVTQALGNFVTALMGGVTKGMVGFIISSALFIYLLRPKVKSAFMSPESQQK